MLKNEALPIAAHTAPNMRYIKIITQIKTSRLKPIFLTIGFCLIFSNFLPPNYKYLVNKVVVVFTKYHIVKHILI